MKTLFCTLFILVFSTAMRTPDDASLVVLTSPTNTSSSLLRGGPGAFLFDRGTNTEGDAQLHSGVDIVANQSSMDKETYKVMATSDGTVAYSRVNGGAALGYGYTVIIDHGNDHYTLYAHLAIQASQGLVKVGDQVSKGQTIGYMADLANGEKSSGNVLASVVQPFDKIQLHIEVFNAPSGRSSTGAIQPIKNGCTLLDPTPALLSLGYSSF